MHRSFQSLFDLTDSCFSPIKEDSNSDKFIIHHPKLFSLKLPASVSTRDYCALLQMPTIHCRSAPHSFKQKNETLVGLRYFS